MLLTDLNVQTSEDQLDVIIENLKKAGITLQFLYVTFIVILIKNENTKTDITEKHFFAVCRFLWMKTEVMEVKVGLCHRHLPPARVRAWADSRLKVCRWSETSWLLWMRRMVCRKSTLLGLTHLYMFTHKKYDSNEFLESFITWAFFLQWCSGEVVHLQVYRPEADGLALSAHYRHLTDHPHRGIQSGVFLKFKRCDSHVLPKVLMSRVWWL